MGSISVPYNKKPSVVEAFKMDMSFPLIAHNIEYIGDKEYAIYAAVKYKTSVIGVVGLIRYDYLNKQVFIKIMDETVGPCYYNMDRSVFDKLTPLTEPSFAQEWRKKIKSKLN